MNINLDIKEHEIETLRTAAEARGWPVRKYVTYLVRAALIGGVDIKFRVEPLVITSATQEAAKNVKTDIPATREAPLSAPSATREVLDPLTAAFNAVERCKRQVGETRGEMKAVYQRELEKAEANLAKLRAE